MKQSIVVTMALLMLSLAGAAGANTQQDKMKSCNAEAKSQNLSGDARKSFLKSCLAAQPAPAPALNSQQQKMKQCNADASSKGLKGADRKNYLKTCLKG
jgi:hypothetical protein